MSFTLFVAAAYHANQCNYTNILHEQCGIDFGHDDDGKLDTDYKCIFPTMQQNNIILFLDLIWYYPCDKLIICILIVLLSWNVWCL